MWWAMMMMMMMMMMRWLVVECWWTMAEGCAVRVDPLMMLLLR